MLRCTFLFISLSVLVDFSTLQAGFDEAIMTSNARSEPSDPPAGPCPGSGDCCTENGTPGCSDFECCDLICFFDPSCCDFEWGRDCADLASDLCSPSACGGGGGDTGACCSVAGPAYTCFNNVSQTDCLSTGNSYRGDNVSCAAVTCGCADAECDWCWFGTSAQNNCPSAWQNDGSCDCGCQYCDPDCASCGSTADGACCSPEGPAFACSNNVTEANCMGGGGAYRGDDVTCTSNLCGCSDAECDWCWFGTSAQNACPSEWQNDGSCDCGCQFCDPDCPSCAPDAGGACCNAEGPAFTCLDNITEEDCVNGGNAYRGDNVSCTSVICGCGTSPCEFCWDGTLSENDCPLVWNGDGICDCGCQYEDTDCDTCSNSSCEPWESACNCPEDCGVRCGDRCCSASEDVAACSSDCADLTGFAEFQTCFSGGGGAVRAECTKYDFEPDGDIDHNDYETYIGQMFVGP